MGNNYFKEKVLPHILSVFVFIVILAIYFNAAFFDGQHLLQNDILQGLGGGQESNEYRDNTGEEALWTNSMFGGMPLYLVNLYFSGEWINKIRHISLLFPKPADTVFLNFICFYILLCVARIRPAVAFLGAFIYAFGSFNIISLEAGHVWKVRAIAFMPLVFAGALLLLRQRYVIGLGVTALGAALELGAQHYQITYYLGLILLLFFANKFFYMIRRGELKVFINASLLIMVAGILALGTAFGRLWAVAEYGKASIRGKTELTAEKKDVSSGLDRDYAFNWSMGKMETLTLLVPNMFGGASGTDIGKKSETFQLLRKNQVPLNSANDFVSKAPTYWGPQPFTSGPVYTGIIVIFLFIMGMFVLKPEEKWWALIAVVLSVLLSWGKHFELLNYAMFDYFPGYNKFRTVSMAMTIALFCIPFIASLTLERIVQNYKQPLLEKYLLYSFGSIASILVLVLVFSGWPDYISTVDVQLPEWLLEALREDRKRMLVKDAFRSLFLVLASGLLFYIFIREKLSLKYFLGIFLTLTVFDLYSIDKRYLNNGHFSNTSVQKYFTPTPVDELIQKDTALSYRVFNIQNPFNDARTSYFHKSIGGYHGAKMRRYQDMIERHISRNNLSVLNMLNTKYIITGDSRQPVQINPDALGNAWFVGEVIPVQSPDQEIEELSSFDPKKTAYVDTSKFKLNTYIFDTTGTIYLDEYKPNYLKYQVNTNKDAFAVFSEIYYSPGWETYIDGNKASHVRVNYILRGMEVPAGTKKIEFKFVPDAYHVGNKIMWISSLLITVLFAGGILTLFYKPKSKNK